MQCCVPVQLRNLRPRPASMSHRQQLTQCVCGLPHTPLEMITLALQVMILLSLSKHHCIVLLHHSAEIYIVFGSCVGPLLQLQAEDREASSRGGHAFLHDFCMTIPYGMGVGAAGILSLCFRAYTPSLVLLGAATAVEFLAVLSLKRWQQQQGSQLFTAISAGAVLRPTKSHSAFQSSATGQVQGKAKCDAAVDCFAGTLRSDNQ